MILLISILLWLFCLGLLVRIVYCFLKEYSPTKFEKITWLLLIAFSIPLLFRPHEDIYGGQDPGSYLNSAVSYGRHQSLFYQDELLAGVAPEKRDAFLYGHEGFRKTKGACLWIKDMDKAVVGPWFQPAYPILMSLLPSMGLKLGILYVAPIFALFTGLVLSALAYKLFRHRWAGFSAFLFYILNPNTIWHGRCPRPEMIAGFLVFAGIVLLVDLLKNKSENQICDTILMAAAFAVAPFFHITSAMVVLPICLWLILLVITGRPFLILTVPCFALGFHFFLYQLKNITDCYNILNRLEALGSNPNLYGMAAVVILTVLLIRLRPNGRFEKDRLKTPIFHISSKMQFIIAACLGIVSSLIILTAYIGVLESGTRIGQYSVFRYMRLTNIRGCVILLSRPLAVIGLLGWLTLFFRRNIAFSAKIIILSSLVPAIISLGSLPHFMYFSRRIQPFLIPAFAIALTSIVTLIPYKKKHYANAIFILLSVLILSLGIRNRTSLFTITENKGFISYLGEFADEIKREDGMLLCEYSRIAAPFDHLFGIPTLGIDSDRKPDYAKAETAWKEIMLTHPERAAYFLTPFQAPLSEHFNFLPIVTKTIEYKQLRTFTKLPIPSRTGSQTLSLYKMSINDSSEHTYKFPYERSFGQSNMGFKNFSKGRSRVWKISSLLCIANDSITVPLSSEVESTPDQTDLLLFFNTPTKNPIIPKVQYGGNEISNASWQDLGAKWWLFHCTIKPSVESDIMISCQQDMYLSDIHFASKNKIIALSQLGENAPNGVTFDCGMDARWCRADAEVLLPLPANQESLVLVYGKTSEKGQTLELSSADTDNIAKYANPKPEWQWFSFLINPAKDSTDRTWVKMKATPPWDPQQSRWPTDLGILAGRIIVITK